MMLQQSFLRAMLPRWNKIVGRRVLFGWADGEPGQVMTIPRELLYDESLRHIVQRPIEEFAKLRVLPPLAQLGPQMLGAPLMLFTPRPQGHFVEVLAVFERPTTPASLYIDVLMPAGGNSITMFNVSFSYKATCDSFTRWRRRKWLDASGH